MLSVQGDAFFMKEAYKEAQKAYDAGEVPIGAVIVAKNKIIAKAYNQTQLLNDVTAHAEILAITAASSFLGNKYLTNCTLFVTVEPCIMCAGALRWSQISRIVYGASEDKTGFMRYGKELLHPGTKLEFGILHDDCAELMKRFFKEKRK